MSANEHRPEYLAHLRETAGLPVLRCPNCGAYEAHWVPSSLEGIGHFICQEEGDAA